MLNSGISALLIQLWSESVWSWKEKKRETREKMDEMELKSNWKELKKKKNIQMKKKWRKIEKFKSYSKVGSLKVNIYWSSCVVYIHMLKSITAFYPLTWLFFHSPSIWPQYPKIHESLIQLCISHQCQFSSYA